MTNYIKTLTVRKALATVAFVCFTGVLFITVLLDTEQCLKTATGSMLHMCTM